MALRNNAGRISGRYRAPEAHWINPKVARLCDIQAYEEVAELLVYVDSGGDLRRVGGVDRLPSMGDADQKPGEPGATFPLPEPQGPVVCRDYLRDLDPVARWRQGSRRLVTQAQRFADPRQNHLTQIVAPARSLIGIFQT